MRGRGGEGEGEQWRGGGGSRGRGSRGGGGGGRTGGGESRVRGGGGEQCFEFSVHWMEGGGDLDQGRETLKKQRIESILQSMYTFDDLFLIGLLHHHCFPTVCRRPPHSSQPHLSQMLVTEPK